jgi:hypothetical protein
MCINWKQSSRHSLSRYQMHTFISAGMRYVKTGGAGSAHEEDGKCAQGFDWEA